MRGFSTATPKLIENKFALGEPTKELLEDWDSRAVQSVLELHDVVGADKYCCEFLLDRKLFFKISKKVDAKEIQPRFLARPCASETKRQCFLQLFRNLVFIIIVCSISIRISIITLTIHFMYLLIHALLFKQVHF